MPIETRCTGCGCQLRVADEHAGKHARCPKCNTIYTVPSAASASPADEFTSGSPQTADTWFLQTPEGQFYGPTSRQQLDQWQAEGRITADCYLRQGENGDWQPAGHIYPTLQSTSTARSPGRNPFSEMPSRAGGVQPVPARPGYGVPHRGGLILAFGILAWVVCPIFGILAWSMGSSDLREMRLGRMDPSGMGLTQAGQILGMIYTLIWVAGFVLFLLFLFIAMAGAAR